ncbi:signal peptide peptidase SppA [Aeoliella sp. SH292]|uniref:signal peptide peptidase SppA n=1 Tax=Aeoliella sp. SH292 TaxID=3454464 RepID=UPI003F9D49E7
MKSLDLKPWTNLLALALVAVLATSTATFADDTKGADKDAKAKEPASASDDKEKESEKQEKEKAKDAKLAKEKVEAKADKPAKKAAKVRLAQLNITSSLPEGPGGAGLFGELQVDLRSLLDRIERASKDDTIQGLVLKIENPSIGRGTMNEVREAIKRFRAGGKKVYAELDMAMPTDYLIATACDEIVMPESGTLVLPGVSMEGMFYKGLLDKLGVEADFVHMGEAKGAAEPYTRESFSKAVKANLSAMTDDMYEQMVETVAFERPITRKEAIAAIDEGLMTATKAKELGLIDRVAYSTELKQTLGKAYNTDKLVYVQNYGKKAIDTDFSGPTGLLKFIKLMSTGSKTSTASGKKIAVVYAVGAITTGKSEPDLFGETSVMGSTTIIEALRDAAADDDVAAIVLRINSPGGSAIASDLMWNEIEAIDKPIVASMGDVAASGGYYIAMGTDKIFAEPTTITGSIGVVGGKMALRGLYDKLGISIDTISRGANAGVFSSTNKFTAGERKVIQGTMEETYEQFTSKAAEGRDMPVEQLKKLAGGKVYSGRQAKANGLIDELGTLDDAIAEAKKLAGIDADADVKLKTLPKTPDLMESLFGDNSSEQEVEVKVDLGLGNLHPELKKLMSRAQILQRVFQEPVVLMMPFHLEVK